MLLPQIKIAKRFGNRRRPSGRRFSRNLGRHPDVILKGERSEDGRVASLLQLLQVSFSYGVPDMVLMGRDRRIGLFSSLPAGKLIVDRQAFRFPIRQEISR